MLAERLSPSFPQEMLLFYFGINISAFLNGGRWITITLNAIEGTTEKDSCCN
jgi:hypothetical protein